MTPLRAKVATIAASAVEDIPIEVMRLAESTYQSQIAAQIPKFKEQAANAAAASAARIPRTVTVLNGIDVLERNGFKELSGLRIGSSQPHRAKPCRQADDRHIEGKRREC